MDFDRCVIEEFAVIGKEGSTADGNEFIRKLWEKANKDIHEIDALIKKENGQYLGIWGLMSDFSRAFFPWENNYQEGLYLAGFEVYNEHKAPPGWVKWTIPSFEYIYFAVDGDYKDAFIKGLKVIEENEFSFVGAVQEFYCPVEKKLYLFYPINRL